MPARFPPLKWLGDGGDAMQSAQRLLAGVLLTIVDRRCYSRVGKIQRVAVAHPPERAGGDFLEL